MSAVARNSLGSVFMAMSMDTHLFFLSFLPFVFFAAMLSSPSARRTSQRKHDRGERDRTSVLARLTA